jgi:amidohydrolase
VDPIVAAADIVLAAQGLVSRETDITTDPLVVSVGSFRAGNRYNIIPDRAELVGTVRSFDPKLRERTLARLRETAEHTALAHGATAEFADVQTTPVTINDATLTARMARVLERVAGSDRAVAIAPVTVAEDFGELARRAPGFYFFVGATPAGQDPLAAPANHSPLFYLDESALDLGFRSLLAVALDFLDGGSAAR